MTARRIILHSLLAICVLASSAACSASPDISRQEDQVRPSSGPDDPAAESQARARTLALVAAAGPGLDAASVDSSACGMLADGEPDERSDTAAQSQCWERFAEFSNAAGNLGDQLRQVAGGPDASSSLADLVGRTVGALDTVPSEEVATACELNVAGADECSAVSKQMLTGMESWNGQLRNAWRTQLAEGP